MKAVLFNGALTEDKALKKTQSWLEKALLSENAHLETFMLKDQTVAYCQGCFECWVKTPGVCKTSGEGRHIAEAFIQSDLCILLTRVTFGGYSSELKKAMDALLCTLSPFFKIINGQVHHQKRYDHYPSLLGIGWLAHENRNQSQIFSSLVHRNAVNFHAPKCAAGILFDSLPDEENRNQVNHLLNLVEV